MKQGLLIGVNEGIETVASKGGLPFLNRKLHLPLDDRSVNKSLSSQSVGRLGPPPFLIE
jgi:hypothetical protein